jgi:hypothetical protein
MSHPSFPARALFVRCESCGLSRFMPPETCANYHWPKFLRSLRCTFCGARNASICFKSTKQEIPPPARIPKRLKR